MLPLWASSRFRPSILAYNSTWHDMAFLGRFRGAEQTETILSNGVNAMLASSQVLAFLKPLLA